MAWMGSVGARSAASASLLVAVAACELITGADFDPKGLAQGGASEGGSPGSGGTGGSGGSALLDLGAPCDSADACASGHCVDGVCCESACDVCMRCDVAEAGVCTSEAAGTVCDDPSAGRCDGAGSCATGAHRWSRRLGGIGIQEATSCVFDPDGTLVVAGVFSDSLTIDSFQLINTLTTKSIFVAKLGPDGTAVWANAFGTSGTSDVTSVAVDSAGSIVLTGIYNGLVDFGAGGQLDSQGVDAGYVLGLDGNGSHVWHLGYTGAALVSRNIPLNPIYPDELIQHVAVSPDGATIGLAGVYGTSATLGTTALTAGGPYGTYLANIASGGSVVWATSSITTGTGVAVPHGVAVHPSGAIYVAGLFEGSDLRFGSALLMNPNSASQEVFIASFVNAPEPEWVSRHGDIASQYSESFAMDPAGNLLIGGSFVGTMSFGGGNLVHPSGPVGMSTTIDAYAAKLTPAGDHLWSKSFGPFDSGFLLGTRVAGDAAGSVVMAGYLNEHPVDFGDGPLATGPGAWFLTKRASDDTLLWAHSLQATGAASAMPEEHWLWDDTTASAGVAVCGYAVADVNYGGQLLTGADADAVIAVFEP